ncbi:EamA family transporter [Herbaspirillum huttiense]|uniref:EamA family transporter n=1 Tax=Herbaspirillum huttiense TaxID=863372 RepID=UPI0039AEFEDD
MPLPVVLLILLAAFLHASWNALLRNGADRLWSMTVMCLAVAVASLAATPWLPVPLPASWPYGLLSALLHVGYNLFLVRSYRSGELGQTYPIARGSSPLLVTLGAALLAGETPGPAALLGIGLVSGGILALASRGRRVALSGLRYALGTGCFIAAYSVVDGLGVRLSGSPMAYTAWMCAGWGLLMPAVFMAWRGPRALWQPPASAATCATAFTGGLVSLLAYGIVIQAMALAPMGAVSALRETSVLFAAVIGRLFLGETLTWPRMLACAAIAAGTVLIG